MTDKMVDDFVRLDDAAQRIIKRAYESLKLSPRIMVRTIKVARTIADLYGCVNVGVQEISEALQYSRYGEK